MDDYREYYNEEEKPPTNGRGRLIAGLILGLLLGGAIGLAVGVGISTDGGFAIDSPRIYVVATTIIAVAIISIAIAIKRNAMGMDGAYNPQSTMMRLVVMGLALFLVLAMGVYFFLTQ